MSERDRIRRLGRLPLSASKRTDEAKEQVMTLGRQAVERWYSAQDRLRVEWPFTGDFRSRVCPGFNLDPDDGAVAAACRPAGMLHNQGEIPALFLAWSRCPGTQALPNPYDPLIALWEGGGGFRREGKLWELSSNDGPCGGIAWPTARPILLPGQLPSTASDQNPVGPVVPPHLTHKFTPEQWARQQAFADKMHRFSTDGRGRPLGVIAAQARRVIVFGIIGIGFMLAGVISLVDGTDMNGTGPANEISQSPDLLAQLGPRGTAMLFVLIGVVALVYAARVLLKARPVAKSPKK